MRIPGMGVAAPSRVRLGEFELDLRAGELRKEDRKVLLQEQPFQILLMLVERRGALLDREEIRKRLWPNDTIVEFDHSIHTAIKKLRQALGDSAENPQYVETVARRGYRLIVAVEPCIERAPTSLNIPPTDAHPRSEPTAAKRLSSGAALVGKRISHYRVLGVLGGGGMGLLYWAEDIKLGRSVALKFLPEELAGDPVALERFEREARAMSALDHPNICAVHEFGEQDGRHFIVMPLLEGRTLRDRISSAEEKKAPFSTKDLASLALQIADGLAAAHRQGIIHRDIKPSNIFVTDDGIVKILDFGLAKRTNTTAQTDVESVGAYEPTSPQPNALPHSTLTRAGLALGTAAYMSPEQVRGEPLDARTDLFSFGLVLYEMATGNQAFEGATVAIVNDAILNRSPAPARELNPGVTLDLDRIIKKALEKDREARFQSAAEMAVALKNLVREDRPKRRVLRWVGAATVLLLLSVGATRYWLTNRQPQPATDLKLTQLTFSSSENPVGGGAISPDGTYLAYNDKKGVHVTRIGSDDAVSFRQPDELKGKDITWEILTQGWFPDNARFLANAHPQSEDLGEWSSRTTSIWAFSVTGGLPHKVRDNAVGFSVSPDGSMISFGQSPGPKLQERVRGLATFGEREIWLMSPSGENPRKLYEAEGKTGLWGLLFLPGSHRTSYIIGDDNTDMNVTRDLSGGPIAKLFGPGESRNLYDPAWLPEGRMIAADVCDTFKMRPDTPCNLWISRFDTNTGKLLEKPRQITNWVGQAMNIVSSTKDGKRTTILRYFDRSTSYLGDLEDGGTRLLNLKPFMPDEGGVSTTGWTPDGKAILLALNRFDHTTFQRLWLNTGAKETLATVAPGVGGNAFLSPDGKWLIAQIYVSDDQPTKLVRIPIGGGTPELIFTLAYYNSAACARPPSNLCALAEQTPDHKQAVITSFDPIKGRGTELTRFDLGPMYRASREGVIWAISDDGTKIAFVSRNEGPIQVRSLRSGQEHVIHAKGVDKIMYQLEWKHDGKGFIVRGMTKDGNEEVLYVNLKGDVKVLWNCGNQYCRGRESPDGHQFEIDEQKFISNLWMIENF